MIYRDALAPTNVENASSMAFSSQDACLYYVLNEDEVSSLFTVSENNWRGSLKSTSYEFRDDGAVFGEGVLPWTIDIEISKANGSEVVDLVKDLAVVLPSKLRYGIGRLGVGCHIFRTRALLHIAVYRG